MRRPQNSPFSPYSLFFFFFFNDTATTEIYTLSLHDALPISPGATDVGGVDPFVDLGILDAHGDRKSTRLNSSHANISYAVFCLKKKEHTSELQSRQYSYAVFCLRSEEHTSELQSRQYFVCRF